VADPRADDHVESVTWAVSQTVGPFDPEAFDTAVANVRMMAAFDPKT